MGWIEQQATEAWAPEEGGISAQAAADFLTVCIKPIAFSTPSRFETGEAEPRTHWSQPIASTSTAGQSSGQTLEHGKTDEVYLGEPSTSVNETGPRKRHKTIRAQKWREDDVGG